MSKPKILGGDFVCSDTEDIQIEDITITARVGKSPSNNIPCDVRRVQSALNSFQPIEGGPMLPLVLDGICGSLTKAAITHFQNKWNILPKGASSPDGIVDPEGKTIKRFREGAGNPAWLPAEFVAKIPRAMEIITKARATLDMARDHYQGIPSFTGIAKASADKVDKHFHISKTRDKIRRVYAVDKIFMDMQLAIGHIPQGLIIALDEPPKIALGAFMFAFGGGYHLRERNKTWKGIRRGSIYLCPMSRLLSSNGFAYGIIHELAHYVAPISNAIGDHAYFHRGLQHYRNLSSDVALINADSYSQFAFETIGIADFDVLKDSGS